MANFSQLRRRQSSREFLYRTQFSEEFEDIHLKNLGRKRHHSVHERSLQRQASEAAPISSNERMQADQDELGTLMWEMRPRYNTSAGELRRKKRERKLTLERERMEVKLKSKLVKKSIEEEPEDEEKSPSPGTNEAPGKEGQESKEESTLPSNKLLKAVKEEHELLTPSRVSSVSQFSQPPEGEEGHEPREAWDSKLTFILATIGYAVGLGNVWRFPYLAQKNGGGAFLIPYFVMLLAQGLPIFLLELGIGQRLRKGSIGVWKQVSPYLGGIGIASGVVSFNVALYYNTIIAWCLNYFVRSCQYPLPWAACPEDVFDNETVVNSECQTSTPTQYFWYRETLNISDDIENIDNFNWIIGLCLLVAWTLVYLCMIKGITENPKIIYITAIYPYVVLIIFFFRAVTLEGMEDGIIHLFSPKWERLADPVVWLEAGTQIFFSLGLAFGGLIAYSSYNPVNNNCTRDALIVAFTNCGTSLFAGIVIFAIMGFKANMVLKDCKAAQNATLYGAIGHADVEVPENGWVNYTFPDGKQIMIEVPYCSLQQELENSASGTGLAFILFTEAVNQFPLGNLWALLFFLMLFTLGLDSQFGTLQGVIQCVIDLKFFPNLRKEFLIGLICAVCLVLSLVFSHGSGNYIFTLFDNFSGSVPLLVIALFEVIGVSYFYGLKRFSDDIELMTGNRPSFYWLICWKFVAPFAMIMILVASVVDMSVSGAGYGAWDAETGTTIEKQWPLWAQILIGVLICMSVLWIPVVALLRCFGITLLSPELPGWFPAEELRVHYDLKEHKISKFERYVFGFRENGTEGILCPTESKDFVLPRVDTKATFDTNGDDLLMEEDKEVV